MGTMRKPCILLRLHEDQMSGDATGNHKGRAVYDRLPAPATVERLNKGYEARDFNDRPLDYSVCWPPPLAEPSTVDPLH
ncbi:protein of unknown function [Methylocella tundrae]|uniref:Uncharacterized protein n=1 Tax=Methylocella tundrae TaxID=227605 RepID=A0A4U8Z1W3_METTU|nr:protein of unknown function [Methylocella tundrae]